MRWVHMALICVFAAVVIIFAVQNLQLVTMSFLGFNARVPLALLAAGIYLLGNVTGGSLLALLRQSIEGSKRPTAGTP
jgi:putative membrane protein